MYIQMLLKYYRWQMFQSMSPVQFSTAPFQRVFCVDFLVFPPGCFESASPLGVGHFSVWKIVSFEHGASERRPVELKAKGGCCLTCQNSLKWPRKTSSRLPLLQVEPLLPGELLASSCPLSCLHFQSNGLMSCCTDRMSHSHPLFLWTLASHCCPQVNGDDPGLHVGSASAPLQIYPVNSWLLIATCLLSCFLLVLRTLLYLVNW